MPSNNKDNPKKSLNIFHFFGLLLITIIIGLYLFSRFVMIDERGMAGPHILEETRNICASYVAKKESNPETEIPELCKELLKQGDSK